MTTTIDLIPHTAETRSPELDFDATPNSLEIDLRDAEAIGELLPGRFIRTSGHPLVLGVQKLPEHLPLDDRPKLGIPYISPSQLTSYKRCSAAYYLKYGLGKRELATSSLVFGSACHAGWHAHLDALRYGTADPIDAGVEAIYGYLRANQIDIWKPIYDKAKELDSEETIVESILRGYELLLPKIEEIVPVHLEQGYVLFWRDAKTLPVLGYGDTIEQLPNGEHGIIDYKTSAKSLTANDLEYNFATKQYAVCHELATGVPTRQRRFLGVARNKEPKIFEHVSERQTEPFSLERLYSNVRTLTAVREAGVYLAIEDTKVCVGCTLTNDCTEQFGVR